MSISTRGAVPAILVIAVLAGSALAAPGDKGAALQAAREWLALVDAGQFSDSWKRSSSLFRRTVPAGKWEESLTLRREPLGKLISRKVLFSRYTNALPGAPDRSYVIIQYEALYEGNRSAIETVMPLYDDGEWRVSGYFIRQRPTEPEEIPQPRVPMVGSGAAAD